MAALPPRAVVDPAGCAPRGPPGQVCCSPCSLLGRLLHLSDGMGSALPSPAGIRGLVPSSSHLLGHVWAPLPGAPPAGQRLVKALSGLPSILTPPPPTSIRAATQTSHLRPKGALTTGAPLPPSCPWFPLPGVLGSTSGQLLGPPSHCKRPSRLPAVSSILPLNLRSQCPCQPLLPAFYPPPLSSRPPPPLNSLRRLPLSTFSSTHRPFPSLPCSRPPGLPSSPPGPPDPSPWPFSRLSSCFPPPVCLHQPDPRFPLPKATRHRPPGLCPHCFRCLWLQLNYVSTQELAPVNPDPPQTEEERTHSVRPALP